MKNMIKKPFICAFAALATLVALAFETPYLTFRSADTFSLQVGTGTTGGWNGTMEYSTDAVNWATWDGAEITAGDSGSDYRLYLRGTGNSTVTSGSQWKYWTFPTGSDIYCEGDIETLRQYDGTTPPAMNASCYYGLFKDCTKLKSAPVLSATTLANSCYNSMFKGCRSLTAAPTLPATVLQNQCYREMFYGCTTLESAGPIAATSTAQECCYQMFYGCTSLTAPPSALPATTLQRYCYYSMFSGCTSLATAPTISATSLASDNCCANMFKGCTSLTTAPELHATVLTAFCYANMFEGCTALTTIPELTATTLANQCYREMFKGCASLVTAPAISATTLAANCCESMFYGCTKLEVVPDFPDVTLQSQCYKSMFYGCNALETPPALPATTLANSCYYGMFMSCKALKTMPKLEAKTVPSSAYQEMFRYCSALQVSTELTPGKKTWKLPAGLSGASNWNLNMLANTGGSFKGDPVAGTTYYIVSMDSTELSLSQNEFAAWTGDDVEINLASTIVGGSMTYTFPGPYSTSPYSLPAGLTLTSGGALTGSISTAGTYDFIVKVQDTTSPTPLTLDAEYRIVVTDPAPITAPGANLGKVRVGKAKNFTLSDTVAGGVAPYTFTLASGVVGNALPAGYEIVDGVLVGTATEENTYTFTLTVKDKLNVSRNFEYTLVSYIPVGLKDDDPDEPETGDSVVYVNTDGSFTRTCNKITSSSAVVTWEDSWYYVTNNVTLQKGAIVNGKVSLILCDGATLTIDNGYVSPHMAGIRVVTDGTTTNTLTIYAQEGGTGKLKSTGSSDCAGIGGDEKGDYNTGEGLCNCGKVIIYGGVIEAKGGGSNGAGIGGGRYGNGGTVKIYGGDVSVTSGTYASGIGGGGDNSHPGTGGDVEVYGGTVTARAQVPSFAGIGSYAGNAANQGSLKVRPYVTVKAGTSNPPTTVLEHGVDGAIDLGTGANRQYFLFEATGPASLAQIAESATLQAYTDVAVNWNLASTITGGTTPYTFAIKEWTGKPAGISLSSVGVLTGTFTAAGVHTFTVTVTDSGNGDYARSDDFEYTITVTVGPKSITYKDGETTLTELSPSVYTPGTAVELAAGPEKTGYTFDGWYDNNGLAGDAVTAVSTEETEPLTFWAKYTPIVYSVTYKDGDTAITDQGLVPTSYTIESATLNLPATATKTGKGFYGWYTNSTCTGSAVTTIPHGSTENKTFWAKWGPVRGNESYIDGSGSPANVECATLDADTTTLSAGWYIAKGTLELNSAEFSVSGDVKLILADGATLTVNGAQYKAGVNVPSGSSLTIYCQSAGTGALVATGGTSGAGIGGNREGNCGTITIYGGTITATGGFDAAGIGGGLSGDGGTVTIYDGTVVAQANTTVNHYASGIGGGYSGAGGTVAVYGGSVVASANGSSYAGIGGYKTKSQGSLTVGDDIVVKAGSSAPLTDGNIIRTKGDATTVPLTTIYTYYALEVYTAPPIERTGGGTLEVYAKQAINWDIAAEITGGWEPLGFAISGQPAGVSLVNGVLTGSVAAADTYNFTVTVTDSSLPAQVESFAYTLTVVTPDPIVTSATDLGMIKVGAEKSFNLGATISGGVTPYAFALVGSAPNGFTFNAETGVLTGTAGSAGDCSVTMRVTDAINTVESFTYSFTAVATAAVDEGEPSEPNDGVIVQYRDKDGSLKYRMCQLITSSSTSVTWQDSWYYVAENTTLSSGATVSGSACLILGDGATLTATGSSSSAGINVIIDIANSVTNSLTIYGQAEGTGALTATAGGSDYAGIGGGYTKKGGKVNVCGGAITATGGYYGAGIGGGRTGPGGVLNVYGGTIEATAGGASSTPKPVGVGNGYNNTSKGVFCVYNEDMVVKAGSGPTASLSTLTPDATTHEVSVLAAHKYVRVTGPIPMSQKTSSLGTALTGQQKSWTLATSTYSSYIQDGKTPYSFDPANSTIPEGFSLTSAGVLSGRPSAAGNYEFDIAVTDCTPSTSNFVFTLTVNDPNPITVATTDYGSIAKGKNFSKTISPSGGVSPYTFSSLGTTLPPGINFGTSGGVGVLSGTALTAGDYEFTITVTDSALPANVQPITFHLSVKDVYAITYYDSDGETTLSLSPATYVQDVGVATLPTPTKEGLAFLHWYDNKDLYGAPVTEIPSTSTGPVKLYSKWYVPVTGNIEVTFNGASGEQTETCTVITPSMAVSDTSVVYNNTSSIITLSSGWYVVANIDTLPEKTSIIVDGEVNIVLMDDRSLTVTKSAYHASGNFMSGIVLLPGNTLNIYGQSKGTGTLSATGFSGGAGIGGYGYTGKRDGGDLRVYGGTVIATGASGAAGIGGCGASSSLSKGGDGGTVEIYGGTVTATGSGSGAGIGGGDNYAGGYAGCGGTVKIYGGTVTAVGGGYAACAGAGIGGGGSTGDYANVEDHGGRGGTVEIYNGNVTAIGGAIDDVHAAGIGAGSGGDDEGTLQVSGEYAVVYAGEDASSATERTPDANDMVELDGSPYCEIQGAGAAPVTYTITYMSAGVSQYWLEPNNYTHGTAQALATPDPREGYAFDGWFDNDQFLGDPIAEIPANATGNVILYAKWTPVAYTITYYSIVGEEKTEITGLTPATYTIESGATLPVEISVVREGWVFDGWASYTTGPQVTAIPVGTTGNKTFYVRWDVADFGLFDGEIYLDVCYEDSVDLAETIHKGTAPYTFALKAGEVLPAGLVLYPNGTLSGTPTAPGVYEVVITVTDSSEPQKSIDATYTIEVMLSKTTGDDEPDAELLIGYWTELDLAMGVQGGTTPYSFELVPDYGSLPTGMALNGTVLEGTPSGTGSFHFALTVTDKDGHEGLLFYYINVHSDSLVNTKAVNGINWKYVWATPVKETIGRTTFWNGGSSAIPSTTAGHVFVPSTEAIGIRANMVWSIGAGAFANCADVTQVTLWPDIRVVGANAFAGCTSLKTVTIPMIDEIQTNAFQGCTAIEKVYVSTVGGAEPGEKAAEIEAKMAASGYDVSGVDFVEGDLRMLTLDANLGTELDMREFYVVEGAPLGNLPVPTRQSYTFEGWYTEKFGGTLVTAATTVSGDMTLYAHWTTTLPDPVFTVNGKGELTDVTLNGHTEITIPDTVTSIGNRALDGLRVSANKNLLRVVIPDTVKDIGLRAFAECDNLREINIPNGVTNISAGAFRLCGDLESVVIPGSVEVIGDHAFANCSNLVSVTIGNGVKSIGPSAFWYCTSLSCDNAAVGFYIPDSVTSIGSGAFHSVAFEKASLPGALYSEGDPVSEQFTSAVIMNTILVTYRDLSEPVFKMIGTELRSVQLNGCTSVTIPHGVTEIFIDALSGLSEMTSVTIPNTVTNIWANAFEGCSGLTEITIPDSVTRLSRPFRGCTGITSLMVPDSVTDLDLWGCSNLVEVVVGTGVTEIGDSAFTRCTALERITFNGELTRIDQYAFWGCSSLRSISFPDTLRYIGKFAFWNCTALETVAIPKFVTVERCAFYDCTALTHVSVGVETAKRGARLMKSSRSPRLGASPETTTIGERAFGGCARLESVALGSTVSGVGGGAFSGCPKLRNITVEAGNEEFTTDNGLLLKGTTELVSAFGAASSVSVPSGVTTIAPGAFADCEAITSVTLPSGLTTIGEAAFSNATHLATATISSGVESIGANAFHSTALKTVCVGSTSYIDTLRTKISGSGYDTAGVAFVAPTESITIDDDWKEANGLSEATEEQVTAAMLSQDDNGLSKWQNYVLNQDADEPVKVAGVQSAGDETTINVAPAFSNEPRAGTGYTVKYSIDTITADGEVTSAVTNENSAAFSVDLSGITSNAFFKVKATLKSETTDEEVPVETENTIGVLAITDAPKTTVIGVPFKSLSEDGSISVANLVHTANLSDGAQLKAFDTNGKLNSWTLEGGVWTADTIVEPGSASPSAGADTIKLDRGKGVWLTRADEDLDKPIYLIGEASNEAVETELEAPTEENGTAWTLVASPSVEPVDVADVAGANTGDRIIVPADGIPRNYSYKDGEWGYDGNDEPDEIAPGITVVRPKRITGDNKIPAGRGFWYLNKDAGSKSINW